MPRDHWDTYVKKKRQTAIGRLLAYVRHPPKTTWGGDDSDEEEYVGGSKFDDFVYEEDAGEIKDNAHMYDDKDPLPFTPIAKYTPVPDEEVDKLGLKQLPTVEEIAKSKADHNAVDEPEKEKEEEQEENSPAASSVPFGKAEAVKMPPVAETDSQSVRIVKEDYEKEMKEFEDRRDLGIISDADLDEYVEKFTAKYLHLIEKIEAQEAASSGSLPQHPPQDHDRSPDRKPRSRSPSPEFSSPVARRTRARDQDKEKSRAVRFEDTREPERRPLTRSHQRDDDDRPKETKLRGVQTKREKILSRERQREGLEEEERMSRRGAKESSEEEESGSEQSDNEEKEDRAYAELYEPFDKPPGGNMTRDIVTARIKALQEVEKATIKLAKGNSDKMVPNFKGNKNHPEVKAQTLLRRVKSDIKKLWSEYHRTR